VREGGRERSIPADALLVDAPRAPAYELCEQAGATLTHRPSGYAPVALRGRIADGVWAIGEVTGAPLAAGAFVRAAEEIAAQLSPPRARQTA
jgi:sarcosine oxidase subunit alpha